MCRPQCHAKVSLAKTAEPLHLPSTTMMLSSSVGFAIAAMVVAERQAKLGFWAAAPLVLSRRLSATGRAVDRDMAVIGWVTDVQG